MLLVLFGGQLPLQEQDWKVLKLTGDGKFVWCDLPSKYSCSSDLSLLTVICLPNLYVY